MIIHIYIHVLFMHALPETSIAPENGWLED